MKVQRSVSDGILIENEWEVKNCLMIDVGKYWKLWSKLHDKIMSNVMEHQSFGKMGANFCDDIGCFLEDQKSQEEIL